MKYKENSRLEHTDANLFLDAAVEIFSAKFQKQELDFDTIVKSTVAIPAFSVFSLGSDTSVSISDKPVFAVKQPFNESFGQLYTNGSIPSVADSPFYALPVQFRPIPLVVSETFSAGEYGTVNSSAQVEKDGHRLLAVSDSSNGKCLFIKVVNEFPGALHCTLGSDLLTTDADASNCTVVRSIDGRKYPSKITVKNVPLGASDYLHSGDSGAVCRVTYDPYKDEYWFDAVQCPSES